MAGSKYWTSEFKKADARSPKEGAIKRLDRLRRELQRLDPVIANRAWAEVRTALEQISDRYSR
ncbi:hypothetical protein QIS99_30415 [Streptomyces sp. B-S-A8]|uniref:Transposase n=1 Tax=Streptomyces solicavernae TaxID=3043614 RepID=A0ABT6S1C1_9ACTN|nr:hypothetical protein [Streptomyces sp. B-S-A8]MDI3390475.1 hypothetical protein [Streptomyces sp. B-S-A8]